MLVEGVEILKHKLMPLRKYLVNIVHKIIPAVKVRKVLKVY